MVISRESGIRVKNSTPIVSEPFKAITAKKAPFLSFSLRRSYIKNELRAPSKIAGTLAANSFWIKPKRRSVSNLLAEDGQNS